MKITKVSGQASSYDWLELSQTVARAKNNISGFIYYAPDEISRNPEITQPLNEADRKLKQALDKINSILDEKGIK